MNQNRNRFGIWVFDIKLGVRRKLLQSLIMFGFYVVLVALIHRFRPFTVATYAEETAAALSVAIGILVGLRTKAAYDRWWEARTLWGRLINETRNAALKTKAWFPESAADRADAARILSGFSHALRLHLRGGAGLSEIPGFETDAARPVHVPAYLAGLFFERLHAWHASGRLDGYALLMLDEHARSLMDVCGACERIRNTPLSPSLVALTRHAIFGILLVTPWLILPALGAMVLPALVVPAYFLLGGELAAEDMEEPFGLESDDLDLSRYCAIIDASMDEILLVISG